ncbi:hypothetical protein J6590_009232 [Homalodisca vitripennis]|nr:hypothetical protein J6590_009232 [Homalodisca vitripennis]
MGDYVLEMATICFQSEMKLGLKIVSLICYNVWCDKVAGVFDICRYDSSRFEGLMSYISGNILSFHHYNRARSLHMTALEIHTPLRSFHHYTRARSFHMTALEIHTPLRSFHHYTRARSFHMTALEIHTPLRSFHHYTRARSFHMTALEIHTPLRSFHHYTRARSFHMTALEIHTPLRSFHHYTRARSFHMTALEIHTPLRSFHHYKGQIVPYGSARDYTPSILPSLHQGQIVPYDAEIHTPFDSSITTHTRARSFHMTALEIHTPLRSFHHYRPDRSITAWIPLRSLS